LVVNFLTIIILKGYQNPQDLLVTRNRKIKQGFKNLKKALQDVSWRMSDKIMCHTVNAPLLKHGFELNVSKRKSQLPRWSTAATPIVWFLGVLGCKSDCITARLTNN